MRRSGASVRSRRSGWRAWLITTGVLASVLTGCAATSSDHDPVATNQGARPPRPADVTEPTSHPSPPITPDRLTIPAIEVSTALVALGLNADDTVEVPVRPQRAGWFELGTLPGHPGSSVILGHVDSRNGPAVFHQLSRLKRGDLVEVALSNATVTRFRVVRVATYANDAFPARRVYAGSQRRRALNLVTCGGRYDATRGGYQSNVVVYTTLTSPGG